MDSFDFTADVKRQTSRLVDYLQQKALMEAATAAVSGSRAGNTNTATTIDPIRVLPEAQRTELLSRIAREWESLFSISVREVEAAVWGPEGGGGWGLKNEMLTTCLVPYAVATKIITDRMPHTYKDVALRELEHEEAIRGQRMASKKSTTSPTTSPPPPLPKNTLIQWKDIDVYRKKPPMVSGPFQRPPVVSIMGHIDHGKTTLLDTLMKSNLCSREAGRITQSVRAFTINLATCLSTLQDGSNTKGGGDGGKLVPTTPYPSELTIIDTPGHKAFSEMRLHSQLLSDYVLLLVALDEGIQGQTVEIVHVALNADRPIVVVFNKADKFSDMKMLAMRLATVIEELKREGLHVRIVHDSADLNRLASKQSKRHLGATVAEVYLLKQSKLDAKVQQHSNSTTAVPGRAS
jgi:small GTP-binding protein